ncbi:MAG: hypothetical protein WBI57_03435 [Desulfobacterales bacterium]
MKPLYFPFTYISKPAAQALAACFAQTAVYQPATSKIPDEMRESADDAILEIRIPVNDTGEKLDAIVKEYRTWADVHRGSEIGFLKSMADKIPFFDETSSSQIRAQIKKTGEKNPSPEKPDPLFHARLFLHMAQELDLQNDRLTRDLVAVEAMEEDFMKELKGEEEEDPARAAAIKALETDDPGHYMTQERIKSWALLMQQDPQVSGLFITSSRAVLDLLIDRMPEMEQVNCFDAIPTDVPDPEALAAWQDELIKHLESLATGPWPAEVEPMADPPEVPGSESTVALTLFIAPGKTPHEFFAQSLETDTLQAKSTDSQRFKNTLIGLVEKKRT